MLTIDADAQYVKSQQFCGRNDFRKLVVPEGVGFFEEEVFAECAALEVVSLPSTLVNIGVAAFTSCDSLCRIDIPPSVREIEEGAFLSCTSLRSVLLHEGLERIADLAFQDTGLERVTIPSTVREIGEEAFFGCNALTEANVLGSHTLIAPDAFGSCYDLIKGYIAPGFPEDSGGPAMLLYSLLWASCPERHGGETSARASEFIRNNQELVMERILKYNNIPAMTGIAAERLIDPLLADECLKHSLKDGLTEISALLLASKGIGRTDEGEFEL